MGIVIFFVLALAAAVAVAYPLMPGRTPAQSASAVTDRQIAHAVSELRRARSRGGLSCPTCGKGYRADDRFCVRCGGELPQKGAAAGPACPQCGATLHQDDQFCSKCGHALPEEEVA